MAVLRRARERAAVGAGLVVSVPLGLWALLSAAGLPFAQFAAGLAAGLLAWPLGWYAARPTRRKAAARLARAAKHLGGGQAPARRRPAGRQP